MTQLSEFLKKFIMGESKDVPASYKEISSEELDEYILKCKLPFSTLLVDCRSPNLFRNGKIKGFINVPLVEAYNTTTPENISSKSEAVRILLKLCPLLLQHLQQPGCFTDIVVLENYWRNAIIPKRVLDLLRALSMWTGEGSRKTNIWFLSEGFFTFASTFPQWICTNMEEEESVNPIPWTTPGGIIKLAEYQIFQPSGPTNSEEEAELMDGLKAHLKSLKFAIQATRAVRDLKLKINSLEVVQAIIMEEERDEVDKKIHDLVPADVKCPVCYEVFPGEIFQCNNGHCVCSTCCENLTSCPECRAPYYVNGGATGKIRVRALERLLVTSMKVDCSNGCGEKLFYSQVAAHLDICEKGEYADEKRKIRTKIEQKRNEIELLNAQIETFNMEILQHELRWNSTGPALVAGAQEIMEEMFANKIELAKAQAALVLEVFMKTPPQTQ